jgi:MFS transporter, UMF1 family
MAFFSQDALNAGVKKREVFGWAMYDFANSGYTTVVLTAVFATYFVGAVAGNAPWATFAWTLALSISYAIVMVTMPTIGAMADVRASKMKMLRWFTLGCVVATALLGTVQPNEVVWACVLIVLSNVMFSYGESLAAAFLPELAKRDALGKVSGWGWSFGYVGGMLALGISLAYVLSAQKAGQTAGQFVPVTMWITAAIYGLAACVTFMLLTERALPKATSTAQSGLRASLDELKKTWRASEKYRDFRTLMLCAVFYQGGVAVAITLAAVYAETVIGFAKQETMVLIFVLNIAAAVGAFVFGYVQDIIGHKKALAITLLGWIATCVIAAASTTKGQFWWAAAIAGASMGASQSAGRAMAGLFAPEPKLAEFFGLWAFATRLASIIGPLSYGAITWATGGNQRIAILSTSLLFVAGLIVLRNIDIDRGRAAALNP